MPGTHVVAETAWSGRFVRLPGARAIACAAAWPPVLTSGSVVGNEESARLFDAAYDEHARRLARVLAGREEHV